MPDKNNIGIEENYKPKELKSFSSPEWLYGYTKKYRQVFNKQDTTHIFCEFSFFNKKFDIEDWSINLNLRCYRFDSDSNSKEICDIPVKKIVSKYDNVVYVREGWGYTSKRGKWKPGEYQWEVWVGDKMVMKKYFYVIDNLDSLIDGENNCFEVNSLKLYEGNSDVTYIKDRVYLRKFNAKETRFVYMELNLENMNMDQDWHVELFIKFYNQARELKGQVVRLMAVSKESNVIELTAGWGANTVGVWRPGYYTAELVFMDHLVATIPFEVGLESEEGEIEPVFPDDEIVNFDYDTDPNITYNDLLNKLDGLIGLAEIKNKVKEHASYLQFIQLRKEKGFAEDDKLPIHSVFTGNPGTGKTTVAKMMGQLYHKMGVLTSGHVHVVDRVDLVGEYIGQTAPKVKEAIKKAKGGVLFIDEAYALFRSKDDTKDFGREVIEILLKEMSDGDDDFVVIVAGYPKKMEQFLESNPGLKSRFKLFFEFKDYLPSELSKISEYACIEKEVILEAKAKKMIDEIIVNAYRDRTESFGNARFVFDLIDKAKINLGLRTMLRKDPIGLSKTELSLIKIKDVIPLRISKKPALLELPVDKELLKFSLNELDGLIGISQIKKQIHEMVRLVKYYRETNQNILNSFFLHTVLIGNPGTGKTTVARILTRIYKALGILERGHVVETDRQGLVAGFVGQTAIKTTKKIDEAKGGVLFIDEAYALTSNGGNDFGIEAIQTLLKRMEDDRGQFFVFVAGYPKNMEGFLKSNPGLNSRFDKVLKFEDYSPSELIRIAKQMLSSKKYRLSSKANTLLLNKINNIHQSRDKYFGNARLIRTLVESMIRLQQLRLSELSIEIREHKSKFTITEEDVLQLNVKEKDIIFDKNSIGFNNS